MAILTTLLAATGTSVAKILLKKFLAGSDLVESVSEELPDIAAAGLKGTMEQRQAVRIFEDIADKIVAQLTPLFEEAGKNGNLNIEAVAHELGVALNGRISADVLLANELVPEKLARAFRDARPLPPAQLSEAEVALYERALDQTARYLVSVATHLPRFVEKMAAIQLQRISRMEGEITRALESVRILEAHVSILSPDKTYARFEADYRQSVSQNVDELELFGVDIDSQAKRYKLSVAYISLSFLEESSNGEEVAIVPAEHLLQRLRPGNGRLLIRGDAGSGKSTLFRWMALMVAHAGRKAPDHARSNQFLDEAAKVGEIIGGFSSSSAFGSIWGNPGSLMSVAAAASAFANIFEDRDPQEEQGTPWYLCVPFLIRLRDCKGGKLPSIEDFTQQIAWELGTPPPGWTKSILEGGRALVLLDGVDEVPNRDRANIYKAVTRLIKQYPACYYLLSTRPAAVERGQLKSLGFREADVSPLSELDRDQLIDRWHEAVANELRIRGQQGAEMGPLAENLKRELRENLPIARLATNPLLGAMICALHRDRSQRLPESQAELCEALCHMLLHRRERESNVKLEDFPEEYRALTYLQKRAIVAELAFHMVLNEFSALDRTEATFKVGEVLDTISGRVREEAGTVLDGLIERSGMLRESQPGVVNFIHNTFKEYLAGDLLAQKRNDKLLADKVLDPAWQNILLFAAAKGESTFVQNLLKRVLPGQPTQRQAAEKRKKSKLNTEEHKRSVMAVRMRSVVQRLDKSLEVSIDSLQSALFPPATMADAEALADAGDAVVSYLRYQPARSARSAAACIRALRLMNSSAAKACLKGYLVETRPSVLMELGQAVNPLEIKLVQEALLRGEMVPEQVRGQVADLTPLAALTGLWSLRLWGTQVADLTPLAALTGLQLLDISGTRATDLTPLAALTGLQSLTFWGTQVEDLTPLAALTRLQSLSLSGTQVADLTPLAALTGLQSLSISGNLVTDLTPLVALTGLQSLHLRYTQATDFSLLAKLTNLLSLNLADSKFADLTPLAALTGLQSLDVSSTQVADLTPLAALTSLHSLRLSGTQITDLKPLAALTSLQSLRLKSTQITDVIPLAALTSLRSLDLSGTQVTDLSPLAKLTNLQVLRISSTQSADIRPLATLTKLRVDQVSLG